MVVKFILGFVLTCSCTLIVMLGIGAIFWNLLERSDDE